MVYEIDMSWAKTHQAAVDAKLESFFDAKRAATEKLSPKGSEMVEAVRDLTLRGGKRLRPLVLAAGFSAVDPTAELETCVAAGAALELLQSYLLIHDDWMDGDDERRGGPAVHAMLRAPGRSRHISDALGVLAGDLAGTYAWELMLEAPFPKWRRADGLSSFVQLQTEVYFGQHLDVIADADVERMHQLKTGSYTVRGPVALGGILADANPDQLIALDAWASPLGEAFQLRDDLLGTFGTKAETGKPGDDLRHGKRTALVLEAERRLDDGGRRALTQVFGRPAATDAELEDVMRRLRDCGAVRVVESRCEALVGAAEKALESDLLSDIGRERMRALGDRLARRHV